MVKTNGRKKLCQEIGGITICRPSPGLGRDRQAVFNEHLFSLSRKNGEIFRNFFLSSPYPAFLFKKERDHISLLEFSKAAHSLVSKYHDDEESIGTGHMMNFLERLPEITSVIMDCFFQLDSFSKEICTRMGNNDPLDLYQCFKCTIWPVDSVHVVLYMDPLSSLLLERSDFFQEKDHIETSEDKGQWGTWEWSIISGNLTTNATWMTMLGYQPIEIKKNIKTWERMIHPEDRDKVVLSLVKLLNGDSSLYCSEHRLIDKHGKSVWVRDFGKIIARTSEGSPLMALGGKINISEQRRMTSQDQNLSRVMDFQKRKFEKMIKMGREPLLQHDTLAQISGKEPFHFSITQMLFPCIDRLYQDISYSEQKLIAHILQEFVNGMHTGISQKFVGLEKALTPTEMKIVNYVLYGKTTKEIADALCVSTKTIKTHRRNIRKKLGIQRKKLNLTSYLRSLNT